MKRSKGNSKKDVGLIVAADEPALIFSSPQVAESYLEAVDVRDGVYPEAYGPNGEVYDVLESDGAVFIMRRNDMPLRQDRVRLLIEKFLASNGATLPADAPFEDLIT